MAEPGNRAIDQFRIDRLERFIAQTEAVHHAGAEVFPDDVGVPDQAFDDRLRLRLFQVEGQAAFVGVDRHEGRGHVAVDPFLAELGAPVVLAADGFDLDHVGAQQRELIGPEGPGEEPGEVENLDPLEGAGGRRGHAVPPAAAFFNSFSRSSLATMRAFSASARSAATSSGERRAMLQ